MIRPRKERRREKEKRTWWVRCGLSNITMDSRSTPSSFLVTSHPHYAITSTNTPSHPSQIKLIKIRSNPACDDDIISIVIMINKKGPHSKPKPSLLHPHHPGHEPIHNCFLHNLLYICPPIEHSQSSFIQSHPLNIHASHIFFRLPLIPISSKWNSKLIFISSPPKLHAPPTTNTTYTK